MSTKACLGFFKFCLDLELFAKIEKDLVMHIGAGVHIGHTAAANFYIGLLKKPMQFAMRR